MCHQYISRIRIDLCLRQHFPHCIRIGVNLRVRIIPSYLRCFDERKRIDMHLPVSIFCHIMCQRPRIFRCDMDIICLEQSASEVQPLVRIVISTDHIDRKLTAGKLLQKCIQKLHCALTRNRLVEHVPRDQNRIHFLCLRDFENLIQDILLILSQIKIIQGFAQMQIRYM